jgi:hypothetical protein
MKVLDAVGDRCSTRHLGDHWVAIAFYMSL